MSFPRYKEYKKTNVEWLGKVPNHWDVISIRRLSPVQRGASPRPIDDPKFFDEEGEYSWVRIADVSASNGFLENTPQKLSVLGSSLSVKLEPNNLFVSIAGTVGKPCITKVKACIHDGFVYFPSLTISYNWLYRIFEAGVCYGGLGKMGTQLNLNTDTIGSIKVAVPPEAEIDLLLTFLNHETAKIDNLVAEQLKLIELLKEKRHAVISHTVTKGLNTKAKMKESGIEWLGDIPEHWEIKKIKWCLKLKNEKTQERSNTIALENIEGWTGKFINTESEFEGDGVKFNEDDVLFGKLRPYLAKVFRATMKGEAIGDFFVLEPNQNLLSEFAERLLISSEFIDAINSSTYGTKMPRVSWEFFSSMSIPLPPKHEQVKISNYLENAIKEMDDLIAKSNHAVALLQERRTALISAAVTGQIDVRNSYGN
jgi:type I restriction enzyme S subunit